MPQAAPPAFSAFSTAGIFFRQATVLSSLLVCMLYLLTLPILAAKEFLAGAAVVDVSPTRFPVAVNGGMTANTASRVNSPVHARAIVLSRGEVELAIVVVDSCMLPRMLLDEIKGMAAKATGIPVDRMLISATHTHTAPAAMSCLGTDADPEYQAHLRLKIVEAIDLAKQQLRPAEVGWGSVDASDYMAIRRWIRRPDRLAVDPFGNLTVRANMHAGKNWEDVTGESGPEDPELSFISFRALDGHPIAILANLSMHYFSGEQPISSDYFGKYCEAIQGRLTSSSGNQPACVAIMSHGCSGDVWRIDYTKQTPARFESIGIDTYTDELVKLTLDALADVKFDSPGELDMAERRIELDYRTPNAQLLAWSQNLVQQMGDRLPKTIEEVYAREQIFLHEAKSTEVVVQALRIGDIAIATTPTETYALSGLKIKLQSPLQQTMVLDLAGGGDGYIPPPEQHFLGGYNTWPARSAGLEMQAEPKIVSAALDLLQTVCGKERVVYQQTLGTAAEQILSENPFAYFRLDDFSGPIAKDSSSSSRDAYYEPGVAFFLEGPRSDLFNLNSESNRSVHFAGGRMRFRATRLSPAYKVSLWIWNGMPTDAREISGWFYSRGGDYARPEGCEQIGIGGSGNWAGKIVLQQGDSEIVAGKTNIERWTWHKIEFVRQPDRLLVFLNDSSQPEIDIAATKQPPTWADQLYFGGSSTNIDNWEGRLDEVSIIDSSKEN